MSVDDFSLSEQLALITGGGLGIAKQFIGARARVVVTGRREHVLVEAAARLGSRCTYMVYDVTE